MMQFWSFVALWGLMFVFFWSTFADVWFWWWASNTLGTVWTIFPHLRWFYYLQWMAYLGNLGIAYLYFPGFRTYRELRSDGLTVEEIENGESGDESLFAMMIDI